jgi:hypothetical protein
VITPINVGDVTAALVAMLEEHPMIGNAGVTVDRSTEPPEDPGTSGYVGVFKGSMRFVPKTLGRGTGYREQNIRLALSIRMSGFEDGEEGEIALENLVVQVVSCLLSDTTLRGTVDNLGNDFEVQYPLLKDKEDEFLQIANVFFEGLTNVRISED